MKFKNIILFVLIFILFSLTANAFEWVNDSTCQQIDNLGRPLHDLTDMENDFPLIGYVQETDCNCYIDDNINRPVFTYFDSTYEIVNESGTYLIDFVDRRFLYYENLTKCKTMTSFIAETGSTWNFEVINTSTNIYTDYEIINETLLEITINSKYDLANNYRWDMAICNISGFDSLEYYEEDTQGGFEYSTPEELNYINLEYEGLPSNWCDGNGFVLFSSGSKNQLPMKFRINFPETAKEFKMFTGSGTEVTVGLSSGIHGFTANKRIAKDSAGVLWTLIRNPDNDPTIFRSNDSGAVWSNISVISASIVNAVDIMINSNDMLYLFWGAGQDVMFSVPNLPTTNPDVTWTTSIAWDGDGDNRFGGTSSCALDSKDTIHCVHAGTHWNGTAQGLLIYSNWTSDYGWWNDTNNPVSNTFGLHAGRLLNGDLTNDTDDISLKINTHDVIFITESNIQADDIMIWSSRDDFATRQRIHTSNSDQFVSLTIDPRDDHMFITFKIVGNAIAVLNASREGWNGEWTLTATGQSGGDGIESHIQASDGKDRNLEVLADSYRTRVPRPLTRLNSTDGTTWSVGEVLYSGAEGTSATDHTVPNIRGSTFPIWNRMQGTTHFSYTNTTAGIVVFNSYTYPYETATPLVSFVDSTLANGTVTSNDYIFVNVSSNVSNNLEASTFVDFNGSLQFWFNMDDRNATHVFDNSTHKRHGEITGDFTGAGKRGGAVEFFEDSNDGIQMPVFDDNYNNNFTFCTWLKERDDESAGSQIIVEARDGSAVQKWRARIGSANQIIFNSRNFDNSQNQFDATSSFVFDDEQWHHVCIYYGHPFKRIYIDGVEDVESNTAPRGTMLQGAGELTIGKAVNNIDEINATMDEIMLFDYPLSVTEIKALYDSKSNQYQNNFSNLTDNKYDITAWTIDEAGNTNKTTRTIIVETGEPPVGDTCDCSSIQAGTVVDCSESCDIEACDAEGNDILISGFGNILISGDITNYGNVRIIGDSPTNRCTVTCLGGCFRK